MKIKVTLSTEDGEVLDQFSLRQHTLNAAPETPIELSHEVREILESHFESEDPS